MISVALCTYNGERYVESQLRSILGQTMPVDEIVVCDDGSTDGTMAVVERVGEDFPGIISINRNNPNLGVVGNFAKAISLCRGDLVFLSDQDDLWHPDKVETVANWFERNPGLDVVFTDAELIGPDSEPIADRSLFDSIGFHKKIRKYYDLLKFDIFYCANRATGATMAFRRSFYENCQPVNREIPDYHDIQIAFKALGVNKLGYIPETLMSYRVHPGQACGISHFAAEPRREFYHSLFNTYEIHCLDEKQAEVARFIDRRLDMRLTRDARLLSQLRPEYKLHYKKLWLRIWLRDALALRLG